MALSLCVFSFAAFAGEEKLYSNEKSTLQKEIQAEKVISENGKAVTIKDDPEVGCTERKQEFKVKCPRFSWYTVALVITYKDCNDGRHEQYWWFQDFDLLCD